MRRWALNNTAALSLLLCVCATAAWARSFYAHSRVGWSTASGRYTLHADHGRLTLAGPPPPTSAAAEAEAREIVSPINNHGVSWIVERRSRYSVEVYCQLSRLFVDELIQVRGPKLRRSLLRALDDPDRFVAAHLALMQTERNPFLVSHELQDDGSLRCQEDGLRLTLLPGPWDYEPYSGESPPYRRTCSDPEFWRADPAQLSAIRNQWHDRLDRPIASFSMAWPVAATFALPLLWLALKLRRLNRLAQHACATCGYNLTGNTSGVCPECGSIVPTERRPAAAVPPAPHAIEAHRPPGL